MNPAEVGVAPSSVLGDLLVALSSVNDHHAPTTPLFALLKQVARKEVEALFDGASPTAQLFKPFGELTLPYCKMGNVDSLDLFGLNELIIFSFYWVNRRRYHRVLDIGANIGLHSILLSKCGYEVRAYEPDPQHFELLRSNLTLNQCQMVAVYNAAVSNRSGTMGFVRVLGNTAGSFLEGSKLNPYGPLERFPVAVEAIGMMIAWADLLKIDAEGHEKEILLATTRDHWLTRDALVEIGNERNADAIYAHFNALGVHLFAQKSNWQLVRTPREMPTSHHDGTLFVTCKPQMPWSDMQDSPASVTPGRQ
jgi:FkbM family methyltransferase